MRQSESTRLSISLLWGVVISLFILNLALLYALNLARLTAVEALGQAEATLDKLANEVVVYDVRVNQAVPMKADIPFNQKMDIPIKTVIPIDQEMKLPFKTPAGEIMLDVPIKADFPIDTLVPLDFNQTVKVDTVVQLDTTVPIEIAVAKTPLANYLKQAKLNVARLKNRLSFQGEAAAAEQSDVVSPVDYDDEASTNPGAAEPVSQVTVAEAPAAAPNSVVKADLGLCSHPYWPLQPGITWTYNSPATSFQERIETFSASQVRLGAQYEGQDIQFNVVCLPEGLGGSYLGDMRRIIEFGDLHFDNPRGVFLPQPEVMEAADATWTQEFDVGGTVNASQGEQIVAGKIARGQAKVVYTAAGFEVIETPMGPQKSLRVEQKLNLELNIDFSINDRIVPAVQTINLTNVYWFAKDIGLVKMQWQGGQVQREVKLAQASVNRTDPIPALTEDKLVFVCASLEQQAPNCQRVTGMSESNLTKPAVSELNLPDFELPLVTGAVEATQEATNNKSLEENSSSSLNDQSDAPSPDTPVNQGPDLLAEYTTSVGSLSQKMSDAAQKFGEAAMAYQEGNLSREEFRAKFSDFAPKTRQFISQINDLTAPPEAQQIHHKLTNGLDQCNKALELLGQWFDKPDSGVKEAGVLLVTNCIADLTEAQNELDALMGSN
ncbi:MAG: hypothetical protein HS126_10620 [Anaerolineales bacterium]|nr:hypothetical protein [Anaerolineales bacterium]